MFSVTTGDTLQRPAAYRQLWSGLLSDPEYGDLRAKIKNTRSVLSVCALSPKETKHPNQDPRESQGCAVAGLKQIEAIQANCCRGF